MPITPKYQWRETDTDVEVVVELTGVSKSASDVFATDCMLKVNTPPYLLLLDLHGFVEDTKSAATITPAGVTFSLKKVKQ